MEKDQDGKAALVRRATIELSAERPARDLEIPADAPELPRLVLEGGPAARYAYEVFLYARYSKAKSAHTHRAYLFSLHRFLELAEAEGLTLRTIRPLHVSRYLEQYPGGVSTKNRQLSAIRKFFDSLVEFHAVALNPASSVSGFKEKLDPDGGGKTPEITQKQQDELLSSIDTGTLVGLRDYVVLATMICTAARRGAVARLDCDDLIHDGTQWVLRFNEKGKKLREIPVRHDLEQLLMDYREQVGIWNETAPPKPTQFGEERRRWPLFRTARGKTGRLTEKPMSGDDIGAMLKRRLRDVGLPHHLVPHSFRVATLTDLYRQKVPEADIQFLAGHADPRTTSGYNRNRRKVTRNLVERISVKLKAAEQRKSDQDE